MKNRFTLLLAFCLTASTAFAQLMDVVTGLSFPFGLALNGKDLYISQAEGNKISKIDISLVNPPIVDVAVGIGNPAPLLVIGDELYYGEIDSHRISKINITLPNPTPTVVVDGIFWPTGFLLNGNTLYITDEIIEKLYSVDISEPNPTLVELLSGLDQPTAMAYKDSVLYISEYIGNRVSKVNLKQSPLVKTPVAFNITRPLGMALSGNFLYVAGVSSIYKMNINLISPTIVASGLQNSRMVAFDGIDMYIAQVGNGTNGNGKISKLKIGMSPVIDISQTNIEIFPNPTEGDIQLHNVTAEMVEVFDNMGRLVLSEMNPGSNMDISQTAAGVYFLKIYADGQLYSTKVVKQ